MYNLAENGDCFISNESEANHSHVFQENLVELGFSSHYPLEYRIVAPIIYSIIFLFGVVGNVVLIICVRRTKSLQTPTYCYLISLAYADLIVLWTIPECIIADQIGVNWIFGQIGCSVAVFQKFLGINAGSLSLLVYTFERYIAVLHPFLKQKYCTVERANKIVLGVWIFAIAYCLPWLGLTQVREDEYDPRIKTCELRLSLNQYKIIFMSDFIFFYLIPLIFAAFATWRIIPKLKQEGNRSVFSRCDSSQLSKSSTGSSKTDGPAVLDKTQNLHVFPPAPTRGSLSARRRALHLLLAVVVVFAICWLPYRAIMVHNVFTNGSPWRNIWFMLFAKSLVFTNSAVNPMLYSYMNKSLRVAICRLFAFRKIYSTVSS